MATEDSRYFFATGAPKSGTVWLSYTLNAHPEIFITGEGIFFGRDPLSAESWIDEAGFERWCKAQAGWVPTGEPGLRAMRQRMQRAMVSAVMEERARRVKPDAQVIGDKTTVSYAVQPERLHAAFPGSRLIHIIRDGRDVAVSYAFHVLRHGDYSQFRPETQAHLTALAAQRLRGEPGDLSLFCPETIRFFANLWARSVRGRVVAKRLFEDRCMEIRYEDLLAEPERIADVFRFLGVNDSLEIVRACVEANTFERLSQGRKRGETDATSHFRKGEAGDWVNHFTLEDRLAFVGVAGTDLIDLGYEPDDSWAGGSNGGVNSEVIVPGDTVRGDAERTPR